MPVGTNRVGGQAELLSHAPTATTQAIIDRKMMAMTVRRFFWDHPVIGREGPGERLSLQIPQFSILSSLVVAPHLVQVFNQTFYCSNRKHRLQDTVTLIHEANPF